MTEEQEAAIKTLLRKKVDTALIAQATGVDEAEVLGLIPQKVKWGNGYPMGDAEAARIKGWLGTYTQQSIADATGHSRQVISLMALGKTYKRVEPAVGVEPIEGLIKEALDYSDRLDIEILLNRGLDTGEVAEELRLDHSAVIRVVGQGGWGRYGW